MTFGKFLLVLGMSLHGGAAWYYMWRFLHRRRPISLVVAALCAGWIGPYCVALHILPPLALAWLLYVGLVVGTLHILAIFSIESQRPD